MSDHDDEHAPSRNDVIDKYRDLIGDIVGRRDASDWATRWVVMPEPPPMEGEVWNALNLMMAADLLTSDGEYLYAKDDFLEELNHLLRSDESGAGDS